MMENIIKKYTSLNNRGISLQYKFRFETPIVFQKECYSFLIIERINYDKIIKHELL